MKNQQVWKLDQAGKWPGKQNLRVKIHFFPLMIRTRPKDYGSKRSMSCNHGQLQVFWSRSDCFVQCRTSKHIWLLLTTKIATWKFYLLFKFGQDCFVKVCVSLFSYFCTYCMNVSHAIPDHIKPFQQAETEHYFDYTNWRLKVASGNYTSPVSLQKAT